MIKTSIEKLAKEIGFDIANSDNVVQSDLLNGFFEGLRNSIPDQQLEKQICYIVDVLSTKSMGMMKVFVEYINLKQTK